MKTSSFIKYSSIITPMFFLAAANSTYASCVALSVASNQINSNTANCHDWQVGDVMIDSGVTVDTSSNPAVTPFNVQASVGTLINNGTIHSAAGHEAILLLDGPAAVNAINNVGSITNSGTAATLFVYRPLNTLINSGSIAQTSAMDNNGAVQVAGSGWGGSGSIGTFTNTGTISSLDGNAISNYASGVITNLINSGTLSVSGALGGSTQGAAIHNNGSNITNLTNTGSILSSVTGGVGILNNGTIGALNNAQGGASPLSYRGALPGNYNIILGSTATDYGKFSVSSVSGAMTFGIDSGSTVKSSSYANVLSGIASGNLTGGVAGTYGSYAWQLVETSTGSGVWNLLFPSFTSLNVSYSSTALHNSPAYAAARVIDAHSNLLALFSSQTTDLQVSNAATQTLPLLTGSAMGAANTALLGINRVIQARVDDNRGLSSGDDFYGNKNIWMKPFGSWADQNDRAGVAGYKANTYGVVFGVDDALSTSLRVGGAFAYAKSDINSQSTIAPQSVDVDAYQLVGYGSYQLNDRIDIGFQADVGQNTNKGRRQIAFTSTVASSNYNSQTAHMGLAIGRTYQLGGQTSLTPSVRADYTWIKDKAYAETGANLLNLNVNSRTTEALIVGVDGKLNRQLNDQTALIANLGIGYDTMSTQAAITAAFSGAADAAFVTYGIDPSPWLARGGVGAIYKAQSGLELTARYDAEYRESFLNQTASVKATWAF